MFCDHCGDCYGLLTDVRVLNTLTNLLGGRWTVWVCAGCGHVEWFRNGLAERHRYVRMDTPVRASPPSS